MKPIISTENLQALLHHNKKKKHLLLVDSRPFTEYTKGHIPSAINVDLMQFHWTDTSKAGIAQFNRQTKVLLSNIGVTKQKFVVFYEDISGPSASRGVWLLHYLSHKKTAMLDGGFKKWKKEGNPIELKTNPYIHFKMEGTAADSKILASYSDVRSAIKNKNANIIIDARSKLEFNGSVIRGAKAGHIPGAKNIDWNLNIENGAFKDIEKLKQLYSTVPHDSKIITYCQGGYRAANSYIALKILGYKRIRMYLGSWWEWGNKPNLPVEK